MKFFKFYIVALIAFLLIMPAQAFAANEDKKCDPILSGLWAGVNFIFSSDVCVTSDNNGSAKQKQSNEGQKNITPSKKTQKFSKDTKDIGPGIYVALGDSIAAGAGLPIARAGQGNNKICGVSDLSYVREVANRENLKSINLACSGATAGDLVTEQHLSGTSRDIEPQLDRAFDYGDPDLMTITAGANDVRWVDFIQKCYATTCGTQFDTTAYNTLLTTYEFKLRYALNQIENRTEQTPKVVITGYYRPVSPRCADLNESVTRAEIRWFNQRLNDLNATTKDIANSYSNVKFAPVNFTGHRLCSDNPWVQGIYDPAPFHPTNVGQGQIAEAILRQLN